MKQAENKSDALWKRMAKLREEVQLGPTALEEMRKSGKNSVKFLDVTYRVVYLTAPPHKISKCRLVSKFFQKKIEYPDCLPLKSLSVRLVRKIPTNA